MRPRHLAPHIPRNGEPRTGLSMGEHCELMAQTWAIPRDEQDQLAVALRVNANTVAKVYSTLERLGALETRRGVGTFIADRHDSEPNQAAREAELRAIVTRALADASARGFSVADVRRELQAISKEQRRDHD